MSRTRLLPLGSMHAAHGPAWHSMACKPEAAHTQTIRIIVLVRKRSQLSMVTTHSSFPVMDDRSFYMRITSMSGS